MILKKTIEEIYKKYRKRPASPDELDIPLLFEALPPEADIEIDGTDLVIGSADPMSPFRRLPVSNINAILDFSEAVAVVMPNSIIFLSKDDGKPHIHIKEIKQSFLEKLKASMCG